MLQTGAAAGPLDGLWLRWEPALLSGSLTLQLGQLLLLLTGELAARQTSAPATPSKRWCSLPPARDPSPPPRPCWGRCGPLARRCLRRARNSSTSAAGPLGRTGGTRNPAKAGETLLADSTASGSGALATGRPPRFLCRCLGFCSTTCRACESATKLNAVSRLGEAAPSDLLEKNPRLSATSPPWWSILLSKDRILPNSAALPARTLLSLVGLRGGQS